MFEMEAVSLGKLQKVLLHCEASNEAQYWYCEKVIIRKAGKNSEYIFNCERLYIYTTALLFLNLLCLPKYHIIL